MFYMLLHNFFLWFNIFLILIIGVILFLNKKYYFIEEFAAQLVVTILLVFSEFSFFYYIGTDLIQVETWGGKVVSFKYEEPWTEEYDCSYEQCDSENNCVTIPQTCTDRHYANYYLITSNNRAIDISEQNYLTAKRRFGATEESVYRPDQTSDSASAGEGDIWTSIPNIIIPSAEERNYENYVVGSKKNIYINQNAKDLGIPYPRVYTGEYGTIEIERLIGHYNKELSKGLDFIAYKYGRSKQINPLIVVTESENKDFKYNLQSNWNGGQKNDSIVIFGVDNRGNIKWTDSIDWSEDKAFTVAIEHDFIDLNIDKNSSKILSIYENIIQNKWKRLSMEKTYGYLKTEIEIAWYYQLIIIITNLLVNAFLLKLFLDRRYR